MALVKPTIGSTGWGTVLNSSLDYLEQRGNHVGTMSADFLVDGVTAVAYLISERTKLGNIAANATANSPDNVLLARTNHTGVMPPSGLPAGTLMEAKWDGVSTPVRPSSRTDISVQWDAPVSLPIVTFPSTDGAYNGDSIVNTSVYYAFGGSWIGLTAATPINPTDVAIKSYVDAKSLPGQVIDRTIDEPTGNLNTVMTSGTIESVLQPVLPANAKVDVDFSLIFSGDPTDDGKIDLLGPSGATIFGWAQTNGVGATGFTGGAVNNYTITGFGQVMIFGTYGTATSLLTVVRGSVTVTTGATAGTLQFRYARNANTTGAAGAGTPLKMMTGSSLRSAQVA